MILCNWFSLPFYSNEGIYQLHDKQLITQSFITVTINSDSSRNICNFPLLRLRAKLRLKTRHGYHENDQ